MAKAKKLPSGAWRVNLYIGRDAAGKRHYRSFTAATKKDAEYAAAAYNMARKDAACLDKITLQQAAENYIASISNVVSPWTVTTYRRILRNDLAPIATVLLRDMSPQLVQNYINEYSRDHAPKTVRSTHGFLSSVLKNTMPEFALSTKLPKPRKSAMEIPTDDGIRKAAALATPDMQIAIMLAANFGLRRGEICALCWQDVQGGTLNVNKALALADDGSWVVKAPKSISGYRSMPIPAAVQERLDDFRYPSAADGDRIISRNPNYITKEWGSLVKACGIPHCRFHDLRHYNASVMLSLGIPDKYAMERMGHATPGMLKRVYQHIMDDKMTEVNRQMEDFMAGHKL